MSIHTHRDNVFHWYQTLIIQKITSVDTLKKECAKEFWVFTLVLHKDYDSGLRICVKPCNPSHESSMDSGFFEHNGVSC